MLKNKISEDNDFLLYHRDTRIDTWELLTTEILDLQTLKKYTITTNPDLNSKIVDLKLTYAMKRVDINIIQSVLIDRRELANFLSKKMSILRQNIVSVEKTQILFYGSVNKELTLLPFEKISIDKKEWEKIILNGKTILNNNDRLVVQR
jgi:hypothetical protein